VFASENAISVTVFKGKPFSFNSSNLEQEIQKFALNSVWIQKRFSARKNDNDFLTDSQISDVFNHIF